MVHHHAPECLVKRFDCCVYGQGHSRGSEFHWMFVSLRFCVSLISVQLNYVCWCIITNNQTKSKVGRYTSSNTYLVSRHIKGRLPCKVTDLVYFLFLFGGCINCTTDSVDSGELQLLVLVMLCGKLFQDVICVLKLIVLVIVTTQCPAYMCVVTCFPVTSAVKKNKQELSVRWFSCFRTYLSVFVIAATWSISFFPCMYMCAYACIRTHTHTHTHTHSFQITS